MKYLLSKGLIYKINENNLLTIFSNGKLIELNKNESIVWNYFSWNPKKYEEILEKNIVCIDFIIENMIKKNIVSMYESEKEDECLFYVLAKNKIKLLNISLKDKLKSGNLKHIIKDIKSINNLTSFDKMIYNYLESYNGEISISDIILTIDEKLFNIECFTDGYTLEYMKLAYESQSSQKVIQSIIKLLNSKLIYLK